MSSQPQRRHSLQDYFFLEEGSTVRHEYLNGEIFAMAGGTVAHNQISANVIRELGNSLKGGPCRTLGSDMRLLTPAGLVTYPDAMVICGAVQLAERRDDVVINPTLLVEVLSDATRLYDLGEKFDLYKAIPSIQEYLVIEQSRAPVRLFRRDQDSWPAETYDRLDATLSLGSINARLALMDIYERVFDS